MEHNRKKNWRTYPKKEEKSEETAETTYVISDGNYVNTETGEIMDSSTGETIEGEATYSDIVAV